MFYYCENKINEKFTYFPNCKILSFFTSCISKTVPSESDEKMFKNTLLGFILSYGPGYLYQA